VFVKRCASRYYCLKVYEGSTTRPLAGWTTLNFDPRTNTAWYGSLHLNNRYLTSASARRKTACHELGHAVGLGHRRTGRTCMRDGFTTMYGHPDATDYANLRRIYA
jgi:predicted Zn-dependent protease